MAVANKNGIVVSGDRRLTVQKIYHGDTRFSNIRYSDKFQKIFMSEQGHVFGIAGCAVSTEGQYISDVLLELVREFNKDVLTLNEEITIVQDELRNRIAYPVNILCTGIESGKNLIFRASTSVQNNEIISKTDGTYGGDAIGMGDKALSIMKASGIYTCDLPLAELIEFMQSVNLATAKSLERVKSVSEKCDVIVITPERGAKWVIEDRHRIYELK